MNLLLDTHVFLWTVDNDPQLSPAARAAITDGNNLVFVSAATAWEIAIKKATGKLDLPQPLYSAGYYNPTCPCCRTSSAPPQRSV
jgi:PIN domain nuclease of toxin-antitoxin system